MAPHVSTLSSYTYTDTIVTANMEDPASVGVQQPGIPKNRATLGVNWSTFHGIQVSPYPPTSKPCKAIWRATAARLRSTPISTRCSA